ncbi:hypothetical protein NCCP2495_06000 [Dietzia sp. NCCP-2495]|uniref:hypothetical protein n=1 Tax=Dietzia sp. NCCP-2495 TaxID=2934675 RepID=UPI00222F6CB3|nr:hypothetical protein [Dietzia sp. NCCP-2495]GLB62722.1 hypothetical protein NCCP2495_06000 [Dietzia sp. NCCP-2495]
MSSPDAASGMIRVPDPADRDDLRTLLRRILRLDEAAVVRLTAAGESRMRVWSRTPFGALVVRVVGGSCPGGDVACGADHLLTELDLLPRGDIQGLIDPGMPLLSAWQGLLPPSDGFTPVEDVPAQVLLDLTQSGRTVAQENAGPAGLPPSLLDQEALTVRTDTDSPLGIDMRTVFSLVMCGFVPERAGRAPEGEPVRVSERGAWLRIDARYGTAYRHTDSLTLEPLK